MAGELIALLETQYLYCVICTERYNETDHVPLILGCNHTFCRVCLKNLISFNKKQKCPLCNKIHKLDIKALESLHKNNIIRDMSSLLENAKIKIQTVQVIPPHSRQIPVCVAPGHDLAPLDLFCEAKQCRQAVCSNCVSNYHRNSKEHHVVSIQEGFMKQKETFNELLSKLHNKIPSISRIRTELKNNMEERQTKFNLALEDIFRQGHNDLDEGKNRLLKEYNDAYTTEKYGTLNEDTKLCRFINDVLDYTSYLSEHIESQPYLLDERTEKKKIQDILDFKYERKTHSRVSELENDLPSLKNSLHTFAVFKNPEFKFSRSDQFLCLVGNDNSTGLWSAEWFCGSHKKLIRYDSISADNRSSIFKRSTRLEMEVTLSRKGFDCVETNQTLFEVDLVLNNINLDYTFDLGHTMWMLKTYTCTNKVCMKTKLKDILQTYLYLDSSQNILTGKFIIFLDYSVNNVTHIRVKSGNGTTIADDMVPFVNLHPVFSVSQSNTISVTLLINSSEYIDQERYINGHKTISNTQEWTHKKLNYTVPYIFASLQDTLVEQQTEIHAAIDIMFSFLNTTGQQSKLFKVSFGQVINDTMFPVVHLEASICRQNDSHTITPNSLFCLNHIGNSDYSRTLDDSRVKLNFYFNFKSGEFHLSDENQEKEIYVFKFDVYNRTHGVPYVVVEHVSVVNMTVTSINKKRNYLYRFAVNLSDILVWLLETLMYTFLSSVTAFVSFCYQVSLFMIEKVTAFVYLLNDVLWFIIEKLTAFMCLLHGVSLMIIEKIKAFFFLLYDAPFYIMEKGIAFVYLLYDVLWFIIEKIPAFMGFLHGASLMIIEKIKAFFVLLYDLPLFVKEKCMAFVYLLCDVLWFIIEKITAFMGLLHGFFL